MLAHPTESFGLVIFRAFWLRWLASFMAMVVFVVAFLLQPFWVGALLQYITDKSSGYVRIAG